MKKKFQEKQLIGISSRIGDFIDEEEQEENENSESSESDSLEQKQKVLSEIEFNYSVLGFVHRFSWFKSTNF